MRTFGINCVKVPPDLVMMMVPSGPSTRDLSPSAGISDVVIAFSLDDNPIMDFGANAVAVVKRLATRMVARISDNVEFSLTV